MISAGNTEKRRKLKSGEKPYTPRMGMPSPRMMKVAYIVIPILVIVNIIIFTILWIQNK